jgi:hypothetical protein
MVREAATGTLLENLIRQRVGDYREILTAVHQSAAGFTDNREYIGGWMKGYLRI